ncbi:hypothetical protein BC343_15845 [Mucilaginibacter pedocola]|uniref:Uncharacterized protein n=1 Tax=Mucilaginibacter pedocola TaxID=1792845 RepID=A0A1S9P7T5_9SPHI|nr:hypothetical protein BC343_15845 [Mucilaginibacter pedocola]
MYFFLFLNTITYPLVHFKKLLGTPVLSERKGEVYFRKRGHLSVKNTLFENNVIKPQKIDFYAIL